jgi:hypothetical protein
VLIVVALLLFGGGGTKAASPQAKVAAADTGTYGSARKSAARVPSQREKRNEERAKLREERRQRKQEARASAGQTPRSAGGRTKRSSSGGFASGGSTRATGSPNQLTAIVTGNDGSRTALVGERRLKAGDDVEGRRIVDVSGDGVKVEYRQSTYTVRVGEKIY